MDISERAKVAMERLLPLYENHPQGGMAIDSEKVAEVVRSDPQAVAFGVRKAIDAGFASQIGWGLWLTVAYAFEKQFDDDSLMLVVKAAAARAGEPLPKIKAFFPYGKGNEAKQRKKVILEMAESDVAACDTYRMVTLLRLDTLAPHVREGMSGNCIVTFPADGDSRPVPLIPRIRAFVNKLQASVPHFPLFLDFDPQHGMWMIYFGCLADTGAIKVISGDQFMFDGAHPSVLVVVKSTLRGLRKACEPLQVDWLPCAAAIVRPFEQSTRIDLLRHARTDR
ncbi:MULTISPECIES: hypothetical protein [unclassified Paraburkholderia]|uniref:hypothetical protein n=1 Tax=unclassified Paraburkholderia TaxID=2615204 RepID=UPI00161EE0A8|nr:MULTISPECIES: hypothetical protein [unclassified Paraburkholderia]MBB5448355.1 hypothetical protein [Paraburkholderia sp. WSM4177]MBB5488736.1 hypothetical protein [Paraburkholderia sp. WSM4180]